MFDQCKMLITGGSGLLGGALKRIFPHAIFPSSKEFDITDFPQMINYLQGKSIDTIFHGAAFTSPPKIDQDPFRAIEVNIIGTANIIKVARKSDARIIYISTDYVFKGDRGNYRENEPVYPVNKYAWSKLGGECAAHLYDKSLIIRTTFGPDVFQYEKAFTDQWTSRECVTRIAAMIAKLIQMEQVGVVHVGGKRKSVYEYATSLDPLKEIGKISINDIAFKVPADTSLNTELYDNLVRE
jgi:dTDP-4-dehydrorhamnose reductase